MGLQDAKAQLASASSDDLMAQAQDVQGLKVLAASLDGVDDKSLGAMVDKLKDSLGEAVVLLASIQGEKITLIAGVSKPATKRIKAGDLMKYFAPLVGGKGGGRPDMASGG